MIGFEQVGRWIADLRAAVDDLPTHRWGTITQADPVRVLLDGPNESPLPYSPAHLGHLRTGDRVLVLGLLGHHVILGAKGGTGQSWATASGAVTITGTGTADASIPVVFPAGRFTVPPLVTFGVGNINFNVSFTNLTAAGMTINIRRMDYATFTGSIPVHWRAVQMTPTSAGG